MVLDKYLDAVERVDPVKYTGQVDHVQGLLVESTGPRAAVGEICHIIPAGGVPLTAEVVAVRGEKVQLMSFDPLLAWKPGTASWRLERHWMWP